jgi:ABC-type transport system involved in multi-copper enzyme maturation permease subunit
MSAPTVDLDTGRPVAGRLIRSELLKIRTTNTWWIFLIGAFAATAVALATWIITGNIRIDDAQEAAGRTFDPPEGAPDFVVELERQQFELSQDISRTLHSVTAEIYTSGQFFGLMFALLIGVLLITNEYHHQTATATFLATPHRTHAILGKLATAMIGAGFFWVFATAVSVAAGATFLAIKGYGPQLDQWPVIRAVLLNGLAYGLWGMVGVGLGVLIRSQIAAVLVGAIVYVIGGLVVQQLVFGLAILLDWRWLLDVSVLWPGIASQVMIAPEPPWPGSPVWWVGALVLVGYAVVLGGIGTLLTRRRDIT